MDTETDTDTVTEPYVLRLAQHEAAMRNLLEEFKGKLDEDERTFLKGIIKKGESDCIERTARCIADFKESLESLERRIRDIPADPKRNYYELMRTSLHANLNKSLNCIEGVWMQALADCRKLLK